MTAELPSEKAVRGALARLITHGVESIWLPDIQPLFELPAVKAKLSELGEDHAAEALRAVLEGAIGDMGQSQYRSLLTIVLGLDPQYEDLQAGAKREIAGQKFRGGARPVSAGTIRQHHEPRALDELARLLVSTGSRSSFGANASVDAWDPPELLGQALEWHPHLHRRWAGEQLTFWRLSLAGYRRGEAAERIRGVMRQVDVRSWAAFELLGVFDVLVSAWVPARAVEWDIRSGLFAEFGGGLELVDSFVVDQIISHWAWAAADGSLRLPPAEVLAQPLASGEIDQLNRGGQELDLGHYQALNIVSRPPVARGIGFFVALGLQGHALVLSAAHRNLEDQIVKVVRDASQGAFSELSIYQGSGFSNFLIHGSVSAESFSDLNQLLVRLADVEPSASPRINTFVTSSPFPLAREESMPGGRTLPEDQSIVQLLKQGESGRLEIKASAFTDLHRLGEHSSASRGSHPPRSPQVAHGLAATVTALLNTDGGTVVIGALDRQALEKHPNLMESAIATDAPRVDHYLVTGIDYEMENGIDSFERRLRDLFAQAVEPSPMRFLQIRFETVGDRTACIVRALGAESADAARWFYCKSQSGEMSFVVRDGSVIRTLEGPSADEYKASRPRR